ncbi:MAG TPA: methylated-DNA--[protein]-cysteine S-methyltransferase [Alphaproteobacteria bacterium]|nr:methylated-DNA--[protein]-cysteine S-methyltransferase [Alphaproteobacteria bacterium]
MPSLSLASPVGTLTLREDQGALVALTIGGKEAHDETPLLVRAKEQLLDYFAGKRRHFELPLAPQGTPFQLALWRALSAIPYGERRTYGELAAALGSAARAVGGACGRNPIPVIIPCHRVVGAGSLGGFSGGEGPATKRKLLALEGSDLFARSP